NLKHYEDNKGEIEVAVVVEAPKPSPGQPSPDETARTTNYLTPPQAPVPSDEELAVAKESFDKLYGREWRGAEDPKAKAALAHRLIVAGAGTFDAPALRYCLFDAARRAAAESAAPAAFLSAMQRQWDEFAAPRWPLVVETLELAGTSAKANDVRAGLARLCRSLAAEALAESQADAALELAMLGGQLAAKSRDVPLLKRLQEFQGQTTAWIERSTAAEAARTTLRGKPDETTSDETSPETAAAHRTLGVWLCLFEEDWGEGRPHLLKCDDRALRELAEREQSPPAEAAGAVDLANAWLSLSETASPAEKPYFRLRAHRWYFAASGQATGAAAKTCEEKLTELESGLPLQVRRRFRNSLGTTFIWCPPGEFRKGSPALEPQREIVDGASRERPHRVRLTKGFWLAQYETTQAEYFAVMGNNPSAFSATGSLAGRPEALYAARFPVESIRYAEAFEFCRRLKFSEGRSYRLPTDAEWEYACRAGASTPFAWGPAHNGRLANQNGAHPYETNEKGPNLNRPTVVGHYPANLWGFHDMHGNVWEWCSDPFQNAPPGADLEIDPLGPEISEDRLHRGGAWDGDCHLGRSATRHGVQKSYRGPGVGFRVALDAE
ncbi:MAG TPA: SUMF1/EgtB/PvdO family nonheme iron enzyme, partial [Pirellulales bacterium]